MYFLIIFSIPFSAKLQFGDFLNVSQLNFVLWSSFQGTVNVSWPHRYSSMNLKKCFVHCSGAYYLMLCSRKLQTLCRLGSLKGVVVRNKAVDLRRKTFFSRWWIPDSKTEISPNILTYLVMCCLRMGTICWKNLPSIFWHSHNKYQFHGN